MKPKRLQRRRTKGFKLAEVCKNPNGYVIIDRTSEWGNPLVIGGWYKLSDVGFADAPHLFFRFPVACEEPKTAGKCLEAFVMTRERAVIYFRVFAEVCQTLYPGWLEPLRGKDVVCTCGIDEMCHGDVYLELLKGSNTRTKQHLQGTRRLTKMSRDSAKNLSLVENH